MSSATDREFFARVSKLLKMTAANGCTEAEAAVAMARVNAMLDSRNLSLADVTLRLESSPADGDAAIRAAVNVTEERDYLGRRVPVWLWTIGHAICALAGVRMLQLNTYDGTKVLWIGDAPDVAVGRELFKLLWDSAERSARSSSYHGRADLNRFRQGFADRILARARELRKGSSSAPAPGAGAVTASGLQLPAPEGAAPAGPSTALVLARVERVKADAIEQFMRSAHPNTRRGRASYSSSRGSWSAYSAGSEAGSRVSLDRRGMR